MPFSVVFSINQRREIAPLFLLMEPDTTFAPLSLLQFTIEATVVSGNPNDHTLEWQLILDDDPNTPVGSAPDDNFTIDSFGSITLDSSHGDKTDLFFSGRQIWVFDSNDSDNDGPYTVVSSSFVGGNTIVEIEEEIPNPAAAPAGKIRMQLGLSVYITEETFDIGGTPPPPAPPWPAPTGPGLIDGLVLHYFYRPIGQAYDKIWRLWVDRDEPEEQYFDVLVRPFPVDEETYKFGWQSDNSVIFTLGDTFTCRQVDEGTVAVGPVGLPSGTEDGEVPSSSLNMSWDPPSCDSDSFLGYRIEKYVSGVGWVDITGSPNPLLGEYFEPINPDDGFHRIVSTYEEFTNANYPWEQASEVIRVLPTDLFGITNTTETYNKNSNSDNNVLLPSFNVTLIGTAQFISDFGDETYLSGNNSDNNVLLPTFNITLIGAAQFVSDFGDETYLSGNSSYNNVLLPTFNITLIGGGGGG